MKNFKKFILMAVSFMLALVMLCGCGGSNTDPTDPNPGNQDQITDGGDDKTDDGDDKTDDGDDKTDDGDDKTDDGDNKTDDGDNKTDDGDDKTELYSYRPQITEKMPEVRINTSDGSNAFVTVPNRDSKLNGQIKYVDATISVGNCEEKYEMTEVAAEVKVRGNYTLEYEKKPIRIKFSKKNNMLGLNGGAKFKSWVLLADWKDLSMSNNTTAFYLGNTILGSDGYYTSDYRNVEVYINGEYWGVYLLVEQQESKGEDGRSSVPKVEDDYTGTDIGYFVEYDGYYTDERNMPNNDGDPTFELNYGYNWLETYNGNWIYPGQCGYTVKNDIYSDSQLKFINTYMENAFKIAYEAVYNNRYYKFNGDYSNIVSASGSTQEIVSAVIDVQSLVDTYILNEIACDPDIAWSSFYISLDMTAGGSHKLIFEAPWDYDSAFGIKQNTVNSALGLYAANCSNPWLVLLINEDWFQQMIHDKWAELAKYGVFDRALELVTEQKTVYARYYAKNFERWQNRIFYGNDELIWELNSYTTQGEAADYLYKWLSKRFSYLNTVWGDGTDFSDVPDKPEDGSTRYRFEAENCEFSYPIKIDNWDGYNGIVASGGYFLGQIDGTAGCTITLTVYAEQDTTAFLSIGLSKRTSAVYFTDWFSVSVNRQTLDLPLRIIPACSGGEIEWVAWTSVNIMPIELKAGENTITLTTVGYSATNVDYFDLWSTTPLR